VRRLCAAECLHSRQGGDFSFARAFVRYRRAADRDRYQRSKKRGL